MNLAHRQCVEVGLKEAAGHILSTFAPLRSRDLRVYFLGQVVSLVGTWMQVTAQIWLVWELTHSAASLGIAGMLGMAPFLFLGPWAGDIADRWDRRKLLIVTQVAAMIQAFLLATLVQTGSVQVWHVYALALILGCVNTVDFPAQQAFLGDLAGMREIKKTILVNNMLFQSSRMIGPTLAGLLIHALGISAAFWINGASFIAVIASLFAIQSVTRVQPTGAGGLEGFRPVLQFIRSNQRIQNLFVFTVLITFFGFSTIQILSAYVSEVLHRQAETLGLLMGASGAGALIGTAIIAPLAQRARRTGIMLAISTSWIGGWLLVLALSTHWPLSVGAMFLSGMGIPVTLTTIAGLLQTLAAEGMRARLISTWLMLTFGVQPIASLLIGQFAHLYGTSLTIAVNGALIMLGSAILLYVQPDLRRWDPSVATEIPTAA